jgi:uncharacterized protein (TIGR02266 family)
MEQPPTKESRVPVNLRIKFRSETIEQFVERYAVDVSRGGIFIRTREPLAVGTQLKFDFQLQDTTPLMAGEGTVVWIREHDPNRAGVTPGMGVRFDKLSAASQPVLDRILADKARREPSGPSAAAAAAASASATSSGKSGVGPLPARRPSSTFSALDSSGLGVPGGTQPGIGSAPTPTGGGAAVVGSQTGATLPFGSVPAAVAGMAPAPSSKPPVTGAPAGAGSGMRAMPVPPAGVAAGSSGGSGARLLPTPPLSPLAPLGGKGLSAPAAGASVTSGAENQSALGRLATGPNLSAFAPVAPRSKSPVPLPPKTGSATDTSGPMAAGSGEVAVPTPVEDSERTQIADSAPDFANGDGNNEPTHVGGQSAIGIADVVAGRAPTITATSRRSLTPSPELKRSLDAGVGSGAVPLPGAPAAGADSIAAANRTTSPDGSIKSDGRSDGGNAAEGSAAPVAGRLSAASLPAVGPSSEAPTSGGIPTPVDTDLARTVPASERMSAITSAMRSTTPPATPRVVEKRRPVAAIIVGILVGVAAAAALAFKLTSGGGGAVTPAPSASSTPAPAVTPPAPTPAPANPEATAAAPGTPAPSGATPAGKPGQANPATAPGEAPATAAKAAEAKPSEAPAAEAKPAEPKPAEPAPAVAEATKPGRKPRLIARKKGAAQSRAEAALEAAAAVGGADEAAAPAAVAAPEGPAGNVARVISLPTGAEVLIDGQSVGKTPFMGKDIDPAAPHALTVRKDGFETYEHMVSSSDWLKGKGAGQTLKVVVKLRKTKSAGETESGGDKKTEKAGEPTEPGKAEAPAAGETP